MAQKHTIQSCFDGIGVDKSAEGLQAGSSLDEQFRAIKKQYYAKILICHPDKGGDASTFQRVQTSFQVLREMYTKKAVVSFVTTDANGSRSSYDHSYEAAFSDFAEMPTPSWDYYYQAAEEEVPLYRVEPAKSGRSRCAKCKATLKTKKYKENPFPIDEAIQKGDVRVGSLDGEYGGYARWNHLDCWRVPTRVWMGLPNPAECQDPKSFEQALLAMNEMLFCGLDELDEISTAKVVAHVMDQSHWARKTKPRKPQLPSPDAVVAEEQKRSIVTTDYHPKREVFVAPEAGQNGVAADALAGKRVVLTGIFPELGGASGLILGRDRLKLIVENLGGRVTGSVSGKTDILIVGKEPGYTKVAAARAKKVRLVTLKDFKEEMEGRLIEGEAKPLVISEFSSGYGKNSAAKLASAHDLAIVSGQALLEEDSKPAAKPMASQTQAKNLKPPPSLVDESQAVKAPEDKLVEDVTPATIKSAPYVDGKSYETVTSTHKTQSKAAPKSTTVPTARDFPKAVARGKPSPAVQAARAPKSTKQGKSKAPSKSTKTKKTAGKRTVPSTTETSPEAEGATEEPPRRRSKRQKEASEKAAGVL